MLDQGVGTSPGSRHPALHMKSPRPPPCEGILIGQPSNQKHALRKRRVPPHTLLIRLAWGHGDFQSVECGLLLFWGWANPPGEQLVYRRGDDRTTYVLKYTRCAIPPLPKFKKIVCALLKNIDFFTKE